MHAQKRYKSDTHTWACVLNNKKKKKNNRQAQRFKIPPKPFLGKLKVQYKIREKKWVSYNLCTHFGTEISMQYKHTWS